MCEQGISTLEYRLKCNNEELSSYKPELVIGTIHRLKVLDEEKQIESLLKEQKYIKSRLEDKKHSLRKARDPDYKKECDQKTNLKNAEITRNNIQDLKDDIEKLTLENPVMVQSYQRLLFEQEKDLVKYEQST